MDDYNTCHQVIKENFEEYYDNFCEYIPQKEMAPDDGGNDYRTDEPAPQNDEANGDGDLGADDDPKTIDDILEKSEVATYGHLSFKSVTFALIGSILSANFF